MRDAKSIIDYVKKNKMKMPMVCRKDTLDKVLPSLYMDENVVDVAVDTSRRGETYQYMYLFTDKGRIISLGEKGFFLKTEFTSFIVALKDWDQSKTSYNIFEDKSTYMRYAEIILRKKDNNYLLYLYTGEVDGKQLLNKITEHAKKYVKQVLAAPSKAAASVAAQPTASNDSAIKDIRAMYEDGIITKEEMLDLIKSALGK